MRQTVYFVIIGSRTKISMLGSLQLKILLSGKIIFRASAFFFSRPF